MSGDEVRTADLGTGDLETADLGTGGLRTGHLRPGSLRPARSLRIPSQRTEPLDLLAPQNPLVEAAELHVPRLGRTDVDKYAVIAADALVLVPVLVLAHSAFAAMTVGVAVLTWMLKGLYRRRITLSLLDDLPALSVGVLVALAPSSTLALAVGTTSTESVLLTIAATLGGTALSRSVVYWAIRRLRAGGWLSSATLMVGTGIASNAVATRVRAHPESGLRLIGTLTDHAARPPGHLPVLGSSSDLARVLDERHVTTVVVGYGGMSSTDLVDVLTTCDRAKVEIYVVPRLFELHALRGGDDHLWGLPLVRLRRPAQRAFTWKVKRAFDVAVAATALCFAAPVLLVVALAVRQELGPGIIFRQTRVGLQGRPFDLLKFRSMHPLAATGQGPWSVEPDQLGRVGRFVRRYSLDELPQLVNVLRGDMSLVGPRPERPEYVEQFAAAIPRYIHRHRVPVGLTGLAAVNGLRGDTSIEDRAHFDNWYIDNWSLWLDIKILIRTLQAVVRGTGG